MTGLLPKRGQLAFMTYKAFLRLIIAKWTDPDSAAFFQRFVRPAANGSSSAEDRATWAVILLDEMLHRIVDSDVVMGYLGTHWSLGCDLLLYGIGRNKSHLASLTMYGEPLATSVVGCQDDPKPPNTEGVHCASRADIFVTAESMYKAGKSVLVPVKDAYRDGYDVTETVKLCLEILVRCSDFGWQHATWRGPCSKGHYLPRHPRASETVTRCLCMPL